MSSAPGHPPAHRAPAQPIPARPGPPPAPANDDAPPALADPLVRAALRHFAEHGMAAAQAARERAEGWLRAGNRRVGERWLAIAELLADRPR